MSVLNVEIWRRQERVMSGITVSISKIMETVRMRGAPLNSQLTKSASKIQLYKEEMT